MSGRKGYDLSHLCKETRSRTREPIQSHLQEGQTQTPSNSNSTSSFISQSSSPLDSSIQSQIPVSGVPLEQHDVSRDNPQQPLRLSPGYITTSGQYTLYNQHTGRGWRRAGRATDHASQAIHQPQHDLTRPSQRTINTSSGKMETTIDAKDDALANHNHIADTLDLNIPLLECKIGCEAEVKTEENSLINFNVNSNINPTFTTAANSSTHGGLEYTRPKTINLLFTARHNARGQHRHDRPATSASRKVLHSLARRRAITSPTIVGGFLAPPSMLPIPHPHPRRSRRLPSHPTPDVFTPATRLAPGEDIDKADQCLGSPRPKPTPQITLTAPSDDENNASIPVTRGDWLI
ncbi:uncharacterized protein GGS22DRAFT_186926 [Annulohypoxylon maeteangense]|uniref:uncharacterized protein n=1 Tax=Annulohypoxylon maeteangense TaxID=1927788 RepID=UPI002008A29C|nr:uncharacterized protein GGS22DRAFT_186926 [Annulohypoxylon maeteangense]KAI0886851.1 hypothetical protein GGS22DRAFT_186926 [Annulohypoxylon maeteangense]